MTSKFPKVLIISHNVLGLTGNMGKTLHAYFESWPKEKLCQLYFHSEVPTTHLCEQYFRVTDVDMLRGLLHLKKAGTMLTENDIDESRVTSRIDTGRVTELYQKGRQRKPWMYLARNTLWKFGLWKSKQLHQWVQVCKPDVIFYASGDYTFSYEIALYLSKTYHIPLVISVVDDFYFQRPADKGLIAWWNTYKFHRIMEKAMFHAKSALYVHPVMERMYRSKFPIPSAVLYKNALICDLTEPQRKCPQIAYFGGLGLRRDEALVTIGQTIRKLIPDGSILLDVFSAETLPAVLEHMTEENGIRFRGMVSAKEVECLQAESNILVFAESSTPELLERLRCSLSTKVSECLGSGRCLLAYGPAEAGSISYLLENKVGCVATTPEELEERLKEILFSVEAREAYAKGQRELALKNHTPQRNHEILYHALQTAVDGR